jgi:hypothetical protein
LLRDMSERSVLAWWDALSNLVRGDRATRQLEIGRDGECYTRVLEARRTGVMPSWEGAESNSKGYDFLSRLSVEDATRLLIEVKSSTQGLQSASFFVSKGEWKVARASANYVFHLWLLGPNPSVAVVARDQVAAHIAKNIGRGQWNSVEVPMREFAADFKSVDLPLESDGA